LAFWLGGPGGAGAADDEVARRHLEERSGGDEAVDREAVDEDLDAGADAHAEVAPAVDRGQGHGAERGAAVGELQHVGPAQAQAGAVGEGEDVARGGVVGAAVEVEAHVQRGRRAGLGGHSEGDADVAAQPEPAALDAAERRRLDAGDAGGHEAVGGHVPAQGGRAVLEVDVLVGVGIERVVREQRRHALQAPYLPVVVVGDGQAAPFVIVELGDAGLHVRRRSARSGSSRSSNTTSSVDTPELITHTTSRGRDGAPGGVVVEQVLEAVEDVGVVRIAVGYGPPAARTLSMNRPAPSRTGTGRQRRRGTGRPPSGPRASRRRPSPGC
jgi:hypothetical protein